MASDSSNRTLVLSVVAVDLVGYSKTSIAEQMSLKDQFNQVLLQAISDISIAERIILDTGDGVAMGFLGDPEDALFVAMFMHNAINRDSAANPSGDTYGQSRGNAIRIGINLGPVKLATGVGGHPNIIGDGINVAERIMSFAEPGQLTASRPFFEVMSRMSDHYATLFQFAGVRTDKQVRSHDVYLVGKSAAAFQHAERGVAERAVRRAGQPAIPPVMASAALRAPATPAPAPANGVQLPPETTGKIDAESPVSSGMSPAPLRTPGKFAEPLPAAPAPGWGERHAALVSFLEDRNRVATTATLLAVIAVTLGALLAYRKMLIVTPENTAPPVAVSSRTPASTKSLAAAMPPSPAPATEPAPVAAKSPAPAATGTGAKSALAPALSAKDPVNTATPRAEARPPPSTANAVTLPPATTPTASQSASIPVPPAADAVPAKVNEHLPGERPPLPAGANATVPGAARDKPRDIRLERADRGDRTDKATARDEIRNEPRKAMPPRMAAERERIPPVTATPIVPTYPSPANAPRPEVVAPVQSLSPPSAHPAGSSVVVVSRSEPSYPVEGVRQGIQKIVIVKARLTLDARGGVSEVGILVGGPIPAFGRETRNTLKQWKFNPGAPGRTYDVEITFRP